ncbi:MAG: hypothetical protein HFH68_02080 [Lachnospiraceae bacterium]|nr:hypothetical protein [Lachnospiraceae bacterium]
MSNFDSRARGFISNADISKALLQTVVDIGTKYVCTVAELQTQLRVLADNLPVYIIMQPQPMVSVADIVSDKQETGV